MFQPYNNMYVPSMQQTQYRMSPMEQGYPQNSLAQNYNVQQCSFLNGKIVDSIEVVKATDITMDGNYHYFPKADGTEVYAKRWLPNGTTEILTYKAQIEVMQEPSIEGQDESYQMIIEKLDAIDERIEKIERLAIPKNNNTRTTSKKEASE